MREGGHQTMQDSVNAFLSMFTIDGAADAPLAGKTFGAKDLYDVAGHVTGCGNPDWARTHDAAEINAPPVQALLDSGAQLVGKTHTDELAYSLMGVNAHYGTPINSGDPRRVPGGSSSGSAAAVAVGLVDIGLGSDTGGSVRLPASFCGVWGMRPSHGVISLDNAMPLAPSFDTVGWFARDAGTLMAAGEALKIKPTKTSAARLLLPVDAWARAAPETVETLGPALGAVLATYPDRALQPVVLAPEGLETWREAFRIHQGHEVWEVHGDWVTKTNPDFGPGIRDRFEMARGITEDAYAWAVEKRKEIVARILSLIEGALMVLPTAPGPAPLRQTPQADLDDYRARALELLCPSGLARLPQISTPAGKVDGGPVGLSMVGPPGSDWQLLELAQDIQL